MKDLVKDARRFVLKFRSVIESAPLQIYSAVVFCPQASIIRFLFKNRVPEWLRWNSTIDPQWDIDPLLQTLESYWGNNNVVFSPDGNLVASYIGLIWDTSTGTLLKQLDIWQDNRNMAFSQDGKTLILVTLKGNVQTWDVTTGLSLLELSTDNYDSQIVVFSKNRNMVAIARSDYTSITIVDIKSEKCVKRERAHSGDIVSLAFSPDGAILVSTSKDGTVCLWDTATADLRRILKELVDEESTATFSPNGQILASTAMHNTINLWNADTGALLAKTNHVTEEIQFLAFSPDSSLLASTHRDGSLYLWKAVTGAFLRKIDGCFTAPIFSPNGELLTSTGGWKGKSFVSTSGIELWETESGRLAKVVADHSYYYTDVSFSPDGNVLLSASRTGIQSWDLTLTANRHSSNAHEKSVSSIALNSNSGRAVSFAEHSLAMLWDVSTTNLLSTIGANDQLNLSVVLSPDGSLIAVLRSRSGIDILDSGTGKVLRTLTGHVGAISKMVFTADNRVLASTSFGLNLELESLDPFICLWDINTGKLLRRIDSPLGPIRCLSFSMDGMILASIYEDGIVHLWNAKTGKFRQALDKLAGRAIDVTFSPDGKMLACTYHEGKTRLWNIDTGKLARTLEFRWRLRAARFSPNGRILATIDTLPVILLWNPLTGEHLASYENGRSAVNSIDFSEDGEYLDANMGRFSIDMICPGLITPENSKRDPGIYVRNPWVFRGTEKILLLPTEYRATCAAYRDGVLVMGHENGRVSIMRFDQNELIGSVQETPALNEDSREDLQD